jgi:hypothetical protein
LRQSNLLPTVPTDPRGSVEIDLARVLDKQHCDDDVDRSACDPLAAARLIEIVVCQDRWLAVPTQDLVDAMDWAMGWVLAAYGDVEVIALVLALTGADAEARDLVGCVDAIDLEHRLERGLGVAELVDPPLLHRTTVPALSRGAWCDGGRPGMRAG